MVRSVAELRAVLKPSSQADAIQKLEAVPSCHPDEMRPPQRVRQLRDPQPIAQKPPPAMNDRENPSAKAALHEFVEVEIVVPELANPAREQALRAALDQLPGIESIQVEGTKLLLTYEPVRVFQVDIEEHLRKAGFAVEETAVASASPVLDATGSQTPVAKPETGSP